MTNPISVKELREALEKMHAEMIAECVKGWPNTLADILERLQAIEAGDCVVVPREPTEAMLDASWHLTGESREMRARTHIHYGRHYAAMIAASGGE